VAPWYSRGAWAVAFACVTRAPALRTQTAWKPLAHSKSWDLPLILDTVAQLLESNSAGMVALHGREDLHNMGLGEVQWRGSGE
jgi:hypothetical protein